MSTPDHGSQRIGGTGGGRDGSDDLPTGETTVVRPAEHSEPLNNSRTEPGHVTHVEETSRTATHPAATQTPPRVHTPPATHSPAPVATHRPDHGPEMRPARAAKTSAAAVFGLVFGLAALFCALTGLLAPAAVVFGIIGLILAFVGMKMAKRVGVTGRGVAIGGLVTSLLGLILGGVIIGGITAVVNDQSQLDRVQKFIDDARAKLPSTQEVRDKVTN